MSLSTAALQITTSLTHMDTWSGDAHGMDTCDLNPHQRKFEQEAGGGKKLFAGPPKSSCECFDQVAKWPPSKGHLALVLLVCLACEVKLIFLVYFSQHLTLASEDIIFHSSKSNALLCARYKVHLFSCSLVHLFNYSTRSLGRVCAGRRPYITCDSSIFCSHSSQSPNQVTNVNVAFAPKYEQSV